MIVFKLFTYVAGIITIGLFGYLYTVMEETGYLEQVLALPKDDIMTYHIIDGVVIAYLLFSLVLKTVSRGLVIGLLILAFGAEGVFLGLNLNGNIVVENQLLEDIKDKASDLLDDMKDKADELIDN